MSAILKYQVKSYLFVPEKTGCLSFIILPFLTERSFAKIKYIPNMSHLVFTDASEVLSEDYYPFYGINKKSSNLHGDQ